MVIKVTYGGQGPVRQDLPKPPAAQAADVATPGGAAKVSLRLQQAAPALSAPLSDAAISNVRAAKLSPATGEQIRDYPTARKVADDVADRIREDGEGASGSHSGLAADSAKGHLVS